MKYQRYTKEFKDNAVKLCLQPDTNRREIADNLGVKYKTICNWISKAMSNPPKEIKIDYKTQYQQLSSENADLKKKLKQVETEREILKKAAAYFAKQGL
ncbi:transposase [Allofrancisella inopinata]|uniref:Transposase n=1 Tax=Allofrancisella inopinata TaxID=1085647 RepID=A0AAE6YKI2_9GAMM|nr:transposase [Allofrancisella inopinata]QIV96128.1 transposase [Allofrancisella inopinata]QIV96522.1 transposase [Allofrancisella inopinata]QIV96678.1 transposase [Allofrancisella inopinata]